MSATEPIRVLHIDDEPDFAEMAATFLERKDDRLSVEPVTSADEGLDRLVDDGFDCILADYDMPDRDGIEFLETVREEYPDLPFILYTGKGSEEVASDAISVGVTDYLRKEADPEQFEQVADRITNAVDRSRPEQDRRRAIRALETANEGISLLDDDGRFVYVNEAYADIYGYEPEELLGEHWSLVYHDDGLAEIESEVLPRVYEAGSWRGETRGKHKDGSTIIEDHSITVTDDGELIRAVRDITERKERERELERYETVVEALGDPVYAIDDDGRYTFVNDAFTEMTGYTEAELIGEHTSIVVDEEAVEKGIELTRELLRADVETSRTCEMEVTTADGERIPCENHIALLPFDEDGGFRGTAGVIRDITERKRREKALAALHEATREFMDAPDQQSVADHAVETARSVLGQPINGIWLHDEDEELLRPVAVTEEGSELVEEVPVYPRGEGLSWDVFESGEVRVYDDLRGVPGRINPDGPIRSEIVLPLGEYGVMNVGSTEVQDFDDVDVSLARILADTVEAALARADREQELRARRVELERQNDRLDEFAGIVSHDLRNPLSVATGHLELAREGCDSGHLDAVARAHDRMEALIEDLLTLARDGETVAETEPIDLAGLVESCWRTVETADATLAAETDAVVRADHGRLRQLVENLFRNAAEHGGEAVTVTVGDLHGGFYVADDGPGIPEDERERVFESGYSTTEGGTGFGLAIVKEIARAHGWKVGVTESEDGGARFEITGVEFA